MKLVHRLQSIGKTSSTQFLNAGTGLSAHSNLPLAMADAQEKSESQEVQLSISGIVKGYHHCRFEVNIGELFTACRKKGERETRLKLLTVVGNLVPRAFFLFKMADRRNPWPRLPKWLKNS